MLVKPGFIQISLIKNFFLKLMSFIELIGPLEKRTYLLVVDHLLLYQKISSSKIEHNLPQCCVAVEVTINNDKLMICAFHSPPKESVYRHTVSDFELLLTLSTRFQKNQILFCGDINFPHPNKLEYVS